MATYGFDTTSTTTETSTESSSTDILVPNGKTTKNTQRKKREVEKQSQSEKMSTNEKRSPPQMSDNLLRVSVYFSTLNERLVETTMVYSVS